MDVGNRIIEAVSREHGSVPIGYIDKWKLWKEIFILHKDVHGTYRLGGFGWQGNQSLDLRENWLAWSGLRQMSEPEKNPTPLYTHTLQKCRMLY